MASSSRYAGAPTLNVTDARRGPTVALASLYRVRMPTSYRLYTVQAGDRWDTLAAQFLGDPLFWWRLADMNPELFDPRALRPGILIRVP